MPTRQAGNLAKNPSICDRRSDLRTITWPVASTPWTWKTFLAKSRPIVVICIADGSHFARERLMAFTPWHLDAVSGSHPPHLLIRRTPCQGQRQAESCHENPRALPHALKQTGT